MSLFNDEQIKRETHAVVTHPAWGFVGKDLREALIYRRVLIWISLQDRETVTPDEISDVAHRMTEQARAWGKL